MNYGQVSFTELLNETNQSIRQNSKVTICMSNQDFERMKKLIDLDQKNRDRTFKIARGKNPIPEKKKTRKLPIQYTIINE